MTTSMFWILGAIVVLMGVNYWMDKRVGKKWPGKPGWALIGVFVFLLVVFLTYDPSAG